MRLSAMELRAPYDDEREEIPALVEQAGLPVADLRSSPVEFIVAVDGERIVDTVGIERHDDVGLLRSLSVVPARRGTGLGGSLVDALERRAAELGLRELVLLTTTARDFFAHRGYSAIARDAAPEAVRRSAEFRSLCPASSAVMTKPVPTP
jgi:amino-acid N-acetyltransferase